MRIILCCLMLCLAMGVLHSVPKEKTTFYERGLTVDFEMKDFREHAVELDGMIMPEGAFTFPGLDWSMTVEEVGEALDMTLAVAGTHQSTNDQGKAVPSVIYMSPLEDHTFLTLLGCRGYAIVQYINEELRCVDFKLLNRLPGMEQNDLTAMLPKLLEALEQLMGEEAVVSTLEGTALVNYRWDAQTDLPGIRRTAVNLSVAEHNGVVGNLILSVARFGKPGEL